MKFFKTIFFGLFIGLILDFNPIVCDVLDQLNQQDDDFWQWIWGADDNQTDFKPMDHIKEEIKYHYGLDMSGDLDKEVDFHMFNLHDFDKNKLLDGLEMLSMMSTHDTGPRHQSHTFERNIAVIDMVLRTDDSNNDGFLDYNEFKNAKLRHNLKSS